MSVEEVLAILDAHLGRCLCQSHRGEKHDVQPPCRRRVLATELVAASKKKG